MLMVCELCNAETKEKTVTYTEDIDQITVMISCVPAEVCMECGHIWYHTTVATELERIIESFRQTELIGISVISYRESVAWVC